MKILFINGSPNKNGNTKALADVLLNGREYETLNLTDYKIYSYGQNFEEDQLGTVIAKMKEADVIVIGSPLYWHNICGAVRNVLDRFYGLVSESELAGKDMYFLLEKNKKGGFFTIHDETVCRTVWHEVQRHGNRQGRGRKAGNHFPMKIIHRN